MAKSTIFAIFIIALFYLALNSLVLPTDVLAQSGDELRENVGLLPTNPFYFIKEWGRGMRRIFTFDVLKKAQWESEILNSKLAELKRLTALKVDSESIGLALENYLEGLSGLRLRLQGLQSLAGSQIRNPLSDRLLEQVFRHQRFLDNLRSPDSALLLKIEAADQGLVDLVAQLFNLDSAAGFQKRLAAFLEKQQKEFGDLLVLEIIDRWENRLGVEAREVFLWAKEDLLIGLAGELEAAAFLSRPTDLFDKLADGDSDSLRRLRILDELRERLLNPEIKSQINILRQKFLSESQERLAVTESRVGQIIEMVKDLLSELELEIERHEGTIFTGIKQLWERAKFNLAQAEDLTAKGNYVNAFSQATASAAAVKNALTQLAVTVNDFSATTDDLKRQYDSLRQKLPAAPDVSDRLAPLFKEAERKIAELSKLISQSAVGDRIFGQIRSVKLLLATIDSVLNDK